jgi:plastocyanin
LRAANVQRDTIPTPVLALVVPAIAALAILATHAFAPGGDANNAPAAKPNQILIKDFAFSPTPLHVKTTTTVTVVNNDATTHTLTANNRVFDTGELNPGARTTISIARPGNYAYHCSIHPYMTGTITIVR